jgi:hypothetical protein
MRRSDGTPWIHSFAHGRTIYDLKYDVAAVRKVMEAADKADVVKIFVKLAMIADLDAEEMQTLRQLAKQRSGVGLRQIDDMLKSGREKRSEQRTKEKQKRDFAERNDPRPAIKSPFPDEPWMPVVDILNEVVGSVIAAVPPLRNVNFITMCPCKQTVPNMHAFIPNEVNEEEEVQ